MQRLVCNVCLDSLIEPHALPCGHSFCGPPRKCLDAVKFEPEKIKCAVCKKKFNIRVADLKPLYGIRESVNDIAAKRRKLEEDSKAEAETWPKCVIHPCMKISLWCEKCKDKICVTCIEDSHVSHPLESYKGVLEKLGGDLLKVCDDIPYKIANVKRLVEEQAKFVEELKNKKSAFEKLYSLKTKMKKFHNSMSEPDAEIHELCERKSFEYLEELKGPNKFKFAGKLPYDHDGEDIRLSFAFNLYEFSFIARYREGFDFYAFMYPLAQKNNKRKVKVEFKFVVFNLTPSKKFVLRETEEVEMDYNLIDGVQLPESMKVSPEGWVDEDGEFSFNFEIENLYLSEEPASPESSEFKKKME